MNTSDIKISLIIATYNRVLPLKRLLDHLSKQTLPRDLWEVIVAVDGSVDGTESYLKDATLTFHFRWFMQTNAGPASARANAIKQAKGARIAIIDDDMELCDDFLERHLAYSQPDSVRTVVIGRIVAAPNWASKALHDATGELLRSRLHNRFADGTTTIDAGGFATGNVSFAREFYDQVGGFDLSFRIDEDRELGYRMEKAGCIFVFGDNAAAIHHSNVGTFEGWSKRQYSYGKTALRVWTKHNYAPELHPLRHFVAGSRLNRALFQVCGPRDFLSPIAIHSLRFCGSVFQKLGLIIPATATHRAILSLQYHRGVRDGFGGWTALAEEAQKLKIQIT